MASPRKPKKPTKAPAAKPAGTQPKIKDMSIQDVRVVSTPANSVERFSQAVIRRSLIRNAPYNPRIISDEARRRLQKGIKKLGMLAAVTWNQRTGLMVAGHQRLKIVDNLVVPKDMIDGGTDYLIQVDLTDMNEIHEVEANILMNNPKAQGESTIEGLDALLQMHGLDIEAAGFDAADGYRIFGHDLTEAASGALDENASQSGDGDSGPGGDTEAEGGLDNDATKKAGESLAKLRESVAAFDERTKKITEQKNPDFYFVTVFRSTAERDAWLAALGLDLDRFQSATALGAALRSKGVPPDPKAPAAAPPKLK
jgi:hypothetical protein